jgi:hypothetical protein
MIGRIIASLVFAFCVVLNAQNIDTRTYISTPGDAVRAAELRQRAVLDGIKQQAHEVQARQEAQRRQFEVRFNQLVDALSSFAMRYNEGRGTTWPQHEADKVRKAMGELQSLEKSLRADLGKAQQKRASNLSAAR